MLKRVSVITKRLKFYTTEFKESSQERKFSDEEVQELLRMERIKLEEKCIFFKSYKTLNFIKSFIQTKCKSLYCFCVENKDAISGFWFLFVLVNIFVCCLALFYIINGNWPDKTEKRLERILSFSWGCLKFSSVIGIPFLFQAEKKSSNHDNY